MKLTSEVVERKEAYSLFQSVKEFEEHAEGWLRYVRHEFSKGEMLALRMPLQFSKHVPGICHEEIREMLEAIRKEYDCLGISRSTFKRMRRKAKVLGILTVYETERECGGRDCNFYVFHRYPHSIPIRS